jgi:hypothetical protein
MASDTIANKNVFIGMHRQPFQEIMGAVSNAGAFLYCQCGQILQCQDAVLEHWQMGHMDRPLYRDADGNTTFESESKTGETRL